MRVAPAAAFHDQAYSFFDLALVWIALFDDRHRNAVGAENDLGPVLLRETHERLVHFFDYGIEIYRIPIKRLHAMLRYIASVQAVPFLQAGACRRRRILRVHGKQYDFVTLRRMK